MRIRMLKTQKGSEDGIRLERHVEGETYDLGAYLSGVYVREGWGVPADVRVAAPKAPAAPAPVPLKPAKNTAEKAPQRRKGKKS